MNNVKRIQQELRRRGLDGMLVTDEKNQRYASGFPITDGAVVVGLEKSSHGSPPFPARRR